MRRPCRRWPGNAFLVIVLFGVPLQAPEAEKRNTRPCPSLSRFDARRGAERSGSSFPDPGSQRSLRPEPPSRDFPHSDLIVQARDLDLEGETATGTKNSLSLELFGARGVQFEPLGAGCQNRVPQVTVPNAVGRLPTPEEKE
jgi:hypothetical protein